MLCTHYTQSISKYITKYIESKKDKTSYNQNGGSICLNNLQVRTQLVGLNMSIMQEIVRSKENMTEHPFIMKNTYGTLPPRGKKKCNYSSSHNKSQHSCLFIKKTKKYFAAIPLSPLEQLPCENHSFSFKHKKI